MAGGRPKKEIAEHELRAILRMNPTLKDVAAFFECSIDTIEDRCKEYGDGASFPEFRAQNMVHTRLSLIRNALKMAEKGNPALMIFCLKNLCGWKDRYDLDTPQQPAENKPLLQINFSKEKP